MKLKNIEYKATRRIYLETKYSLTSDRCQLIPLGFHLQPDIASTQTDFLFGEVDH